MELTDNVLEILRTKSQDVYSLPSKASVYEAVATMAEKHVGALLVIDDGRLVGIISERDYARKIILQGKSSKQTEVGEIMTKPVETTTQDDLLGDCLRRMNEGRYRHLPVVDGAGNVVGVLSTGDIIKHLLKVQEWTIRHLNAYIGGGYPA